MATSESEMLGCFVTHLKFSINWVRKTKGQTQQISWNWGWWVTQLTHMVWHLVLITYKSNKLIILVKHLSNMSLLNPLLFNFSLIFRRHGQKVTTTNRNTPVCHQGIGCSWVPYSQRLSFCGPVILGHLAHPQQLRALSSTSSLIPGYGMHFRSSWLDWKKPIELKNIWQE